MQQTPHQKPRIGGYIFINTQFIINNNMHVPPTFAAGEAGIEY